MRDWQRLGKRHGRVWWYLWSAEESRRSPVLRVEWSLLNPRTWPSVELEVCRTFCDDEDLAGHVSVPLLGSLYWGVQNLFPRSWWDRIGPARRVGISLFHEYLWISLWWADPAEHWGEDVNHFRWQRLSWDWMSTLLGQQQHRCDVLSDWEPVEVPLPERTYPGRYRVVERTWWRARWPRRLVRRSGEIEMLEGAPFPGKGTESWNCGEDAIMSMGGPPTKAATIAAYVRATLENRERYGHSVNWRPKTARHEEEG